MNRASVVVSGLLKCGSALLLFSAVVIPAQPVLPRARQFPPGTVNRVEDLPVGRFRTRLEALPAAARQRALDRLRRFHFTELDLVSLEPDADGELFYVDKFLVDLPAEAASEPVMAGVALPVNPFPASLIFHSKPGAPNVLYLNFSGENVSGTSWNTAARTTIPAVAFSTDSDYSTFSDAEQLAIK